MAVRTSSRLNMASATSKPRIDVDSKYDCPVCLQTYRDAVILLCGHSPCKVCVDGSSAGSVVQSRYCSIAEYVKSYRSYRLSWRQACFLSSGGAVFCRECTKGPVMSLANTWSTRRATMSVLAKHPDYGSAGHSGSSDDGAIGRLLRYVPLFLTLLVVHASGKVLSSRDCDVDPFTYLNINATAISSRQPPAQTRAVSTTMLRETAHTVRRWMPICDDEGVAYVQTAGAKNVFRDAPDKTAALEGPARRAMTKLDQRILEDLIQRASGVTTVIASDGNSRDKRSLSGNFSVSAYLRARDSPYEVMSDLLVPDGVTVNVEKGVELRFRPSLSLTVRGRLVARGTRDDPILFQPLIEHTRWKGLTFETPFKVYDVRITGGQGRSDGYLETYDGHTWRLVCFQGWTRLNADVACKQMGFEQGASPELPTLTAAPLSKSYWLSNVDCTGSEKSLKDCKSQQTAACQRPATLRCLGDVPTENTTQKVDTSILEYVNCSDSEAGIIVRSTSMSAMPTLNFVTAQNSLNHGLWIETFYTPDAAQAPRLYKCLWVNNRVTGLFLQLRHPPKDSSMPFLIEESLATVGGGDGIRIEGRGNVQIVRSAAFGNARNGIDIRLDSGSVKMDELVLGANSGNGISVSRGNTSTNSAVDRLSVSLSYSKFSGHWAGEAAVFDTAGSPNCEYSVEKNEFWENYDGCVSFPSAVKYGAVSIVANNFTRNRGPMVRFAVVQGDAKLRLENNIFHLNILSNHSDRGEAVVRIGLDANGDGGSPSTVQVISNRFTKNTMHSCLSIHPLVQNVRPSQLLTMQGNWLTDNLVTSTVFADVAEANITQNTFSNPVSECELRTGALRDGSRIEARNNFWGAADEATVRRKICDGTRNRSLVTADILPWTRVPNGQPQSANDGLPIAPSSPEAIGPSDTGAGETNSALVTSAAAAVVDNQPSVAENYEISGNGKPYSVAQNLLVSPKSTLTVAPGAVLEFDSDRGLRVQGTIIAKGTEDEPIIFRAALGRTWSGIMFENKNSPTSILEHCIIDGARIGLSLNSDKLAISRCIISNSMLSGITLTDDSGERVDLGDTTVLNAQDIGLRIANRYRSIDVSNFNVDNTGGNGIDFDHPVINTSFSNCRLSNSRRYAMHIDQMMYSKQTMALKNCTVVNQNGVGGVFLVARDYGLVSIANTVFSNNNARSLIVDLKCNFTGDMGNGQPSRFELIESRFENDNDNVVDIHLAYCSYADIARNTFLSNNRDHRYGVFHLQLDPLKRPASAGGKENFHVEFRNNLFRQNAGEFSAYMLPMSMADFVGIVGGNRFIENENRRSVFVAGSPVFQVNYNEFDNRRSTYNLEAEYNDAKLLDATNNYWGTVRESEIHDTIFDGTKIPYRGTVKFVPYLTKGSATTTDNKSKCDKRANCRGNGDCIGDQICACFPGYFGDECEQFSCRDSSDCSKNGRCVGPNRCQCFSGWSGADCRSPMCVGVSNCSSHGECVSLNECQCETGWSGTECSVPTGGQGSAGGNTTGGNGGGLGNNTSGAVVGQGASETNGHGNNASIGGSGTSGSIGGPGTGGSIGGSKTNTSSGVSGTSSPNGGPGINSPSGGPGANSSVGGPGSSGSIGESRANASSVVPGTNGSGGGSGTLGGTGTGSGTNSTSGVGGRGNNGSSASGTHAGTGSGTSNISSSIDGRGPGGSTGGPAVSNATFSGHATGSGSGGTIATGADCPNQCRGHGRCLQSNVCECETGWRGNDCGSPDCGQRNCSRHGTCVAPGQCECVTGYAGNSCEICIKNTTGEVCRNEDENEVITPPSRTVRSISTYSTHQPTTFPTIACDQICEHGFCDTRVGECQCYVPWTGPNCDQCSRPTCADAPIRFISPDSAPAALTAALAEELFVRIVGSNFTRPLTSRYICRFGDAVTTIGVWLSNTDVECPVPPDQPAASLNFSIAPLEENDADLEAAASVKNRSWILAPTFFTFYSSCAEITCGEDSFCFRGFCYCSTGSTGAAEPEKCEELQAQKPSIDTNSLNAFTVGNTRELETASVQLKTKNEGQLVRWELTDGPIGAIINAATGLLTWSQPRGSSESTKFTVSAHSPGGTDSISWSVTVPMTYQPVIDRFWNSSNINGAYGVQGHVDLVSNATSGQSVPVKLVVYKNGQESQEWETWTDNAGKFESTYSTPTGDGGQYAIAATHPGNATAKAEGPRAPGTIEWAVQAIRVLPRDQIAQYDQRERAVVVVTVENLGTAELHIVEIASKTTPSTILNVSRITVAGTTTPLSPTYVLQPKSNTTLSIELAIFALVPEARSFPFEITTRETPSASFSVRLKRSSSGPWLSAEPSSLRFALVFDQPWPTATIKVTNDGRATARNLIVQLSSDSFVDAVDVFKNGASIVNNRTFDLAPSESIILALTIAPPSGFPGNGNADLTGRAYNGNVTVDFVSREPTLSPLIIPYAIEFRASPMIDRFNVSVLADQTANGRQSSAAVAAAGSPAAVPGATVGLSNPFLERNKTTNTDGNGIAQFTNVPAGYYTLSVDKTGYVPFRRVIKISLEQPGSYTAVLEDYFGGNGQQNGVDAQLLPAGSTGDKGDFQLQVPVASALSAQDGTAPFLELAPRDLALSLNNITQTEKTITLRNLGGTTAVGLSMGVNDSRLPVTIESDTVDVPRDENRTLRLSVKANPHYVAPPADQSCDAYLVSYYYAYQTAQTNGTKKLTLMVRNKDGYETDSVRLCEIDPTVGAAASHAIGLSVSISCECRPSVMRQCLASYTEPLAVCGPGFSSIGNSTTDLGAFFRILAGLATCNRAKLNLDKGKEAVGCLVNMQDACSGTQKVWRSRWRREAALQTSTSRFFDQIRIVNGVSDRLGHPFGQLFPFLMRDSVQSQTTESLKYFDRWFSYAGEVLGTSTLNIPTDRWYVEFARSVSDASELGEAISGEEMTKILSTLTSNDIRQRPVVSHLLERWNTTITSRAHRRPSVTGGEVERSGAAQSENAVSFATLYELISLTNVLNALAASQGFPNNFLSLLDRDVNNLRYTLLETEGASDCLSAMIKVEPAEVDEGDRVTLQLTLKNLLNTTAIQINELTPRFRPVNPDDNELVTFAKAESKYPATVMDPFVGQYFAYWNVEAEVRQRLTKAVTFRVDLLLVFTQTGLRTQTQTKIQSLPFTVRPRASLRVLYFLYAPVPSTDSVSSTRLRRRPSVLVALMNNGFRDLVNLSISGAELKVTANSEKGPPVSYRLDYVLVDGQEAPTSFDVRIASLRSGEVKYVEYALSSSAPGKTQLDTFRATVFVDGEFLRSLSQETFHILQWLNGSTASHPDATSAIDPTSSNLLLGVDTANGVQPAYLYNAKTTLLAPINEAELVGTSEGWVTSNDKSYFHIRLQYRQNTQANRPGALYGEYGLPPTLNETNDLLGGSRSNVSLEPSYTWISYGGVRGGDEEETNNGRVLNFVDPLMPNNQELVTYEFVFGPSNAGPPTFQEKSYSFKLPSPTTDVKAGSVLGAIAATDPDGGNVTYGLYGGDGYFVINPKTGEVKVARIPLPSEGRRFCLNAKATDDGYPPKTTYLPVEIVYEKSANQPTLAPCGRLSNIDLLPNNLEKGIDWGGATTQVFGSEEFASVTRRSTTVPSSRTTALKNASSGEAQGETEGAETLSTVVPGKGATTEWKPTFVAGTGAITIAATAEEEAGTGGVTATTTFGEESVEGEGETEVNEANESTAGGRTTIASASEAAPAAGSQTTVAGRTEVVVAISSQTPAAVSGSETTSILTRQSGSVSVPFGQSAISAVSSIASGTATVGPGATSTASKTGVIPTVSSTRGTGAASSVSVDQNEDGPIIGGSGTTPEGTVPPVQNSALPAQAITPIFLPPDLLQGLGGGVNISSLTTDDLVMLACKLRGAQPIKPIWGIICDLGKAGAGTTSKPSSTGKRLLDQIG